MSVMVARIAAKIADFRMLYPDDPRCIAIARMAIEALRDPPETITSALQKWGICAGDIDKGWNAAIDAILKD